MPMTHVSPGSLYIVPTPIGNLGDFTERARQTLSDVDYLAVEDSRQTAKLLNHLGIRKPMRAVHEHNEHQQLERILGDCEQGLNIALLSDAGTPLVSDPGFVLVREARARAIPVVVLPGPCAAIAALSGSALAPDRFVFEGFLPAKAQARRTRLKVLQTEVRTLIFYESTHRIVASIEAMRAVFGEQRILCIAKEITKAHETFWNGPLDQAKAWFDADPARIKGEFVLLVAGAESELDPHRAESIILMKKLLGYLPLKAAAQLAVDLKGGRKRDYYAIGLSFKH